MPKLAHGSGILFFGFAFGIACAKGDGLAAISRSATDNRMDAAPGVRTTVESKFGIEYARGGPTQAPPKIAPPLQYCRGTVSSVQGKAYKSTKSDQNFATASPVCAS
ncbi:hypothetical protein PAHAL_4G163800 [Panicum hallii]|uniref:Uncharacterized protein n=1 Tax=Panicum hallii TaxID=206008 RepID=A0A2T8JD71_9POAL|nr:hypothetical protein PAHAL_4G163800 [Panicum hallii]